MNQHGADDQLNFLYNLRAVVVVLIIVVHGARTYMVYAPEWWYVVDISTSWFFTVLVAILDVPLIFVLLFIAGYFTYPSLVIQRPRGFLIEKLTRKGVPWIIGVLLLTPPVAYLILLSRDMNVPFSLFLEIHFWEQYYQQSVYWLLGIFLFLYGCTYLLFTSSDTFQSLKLRIKEPTWTVIGVFIGVMSILFFVVNQFVPLDQWEHFGFLFVVQPVRIPLYIGYFFLGVYAFTRGWFRESGYRPDIYLWIPLAFISGVAYLTARLAMHYEAGPHLALSGVTAVSFNMFCFASLISLIAVFQTYNNNRSMFWKLHARNAYGMYYLHPLIVFPLALILLDIQISIFIKAPLVIGAGWAVSLMLSEFILTKSPGLSEIFTTPN